MSAPLHGARCATTFPRIVVFVGGIALWELGVRVLQLQRPHPAAAIGIGTALVDNWRPATGSSRGPVDAVSRRSAGSPSGSPAGLVVAFARLALRRAADALMPFAIAANAIPIIAFAPIANSWFGVTSPVSKMMIAAMLVFFPVMINTVRGLTQRRAVARSS